MYRSITLARLPSDKRRLSSLALFVRWFLIGLAITLSTIAVIGVHLRWFEVDTFPGSFLYRLHDDVFLRLKGVLHTQFYPEYALWTLLGIVATLGVIWLIASLTGVSPLREPHIWLWRLAIRRAVTYDRLLNLLQVFRHFGFRPYLVRLVVLDEWERTRAQVRRLAQEERPAHIDRLIALLAFALQIEKLIPPKRQTPRELTQRWHLTVLIAQRGSDRDHYRAETWIKLDDLRRELPAAQFSEDDQSKQYGGFGWNTLMDDMRLLFMLSRQSRIALDDHMTSIKLSGTEFEPAYSVLERLLERCEQRLNLLRGVYQYGERLLFAEFSANGLTPPPLASRADSITGQLTLQLTAHFACMTEQSYLLKTYLDLLDSVAMLVDTHASHDLQAWAALLEFPGTPPPNAIHFPVEVHDIDAELAGGLLDEQSASWKFATGEKDHLFHQSDFAFVQEIHVSTARRRAGDQS